MASRLRCWSGFELHPTSREWCMGVLQAVGKHASVSVDSGMDKAKFHMPKGSKRKLNPATVLTWFWNVLFKCEISLIGSYVWILASWVVALFGEGIETWEDKTSLKELRCWVMELDYRPLSLWPMVLGLWTSMPLVFWDCFDEINLYPRSWSCSKMTNWSFLKPLATEKPSSPKLWLLAIWSQWGRR